MKGAPKRPLAHAVARLSQLGKALLVTGLAVPLLGCDRRPVPPTVGAHALVFQRYEAEDGKATLSTDPLVTRHGTILVASVGRGDVNAFAPPTDNRGGAPFDQLGETHTYTNWPRSGTALYAQATGPRGEGHVVSTTTPADDELTLALVEVSGARVQDFAWTEVLAGRPITSARVTTTGPATLVSFWWGDAGVKGDKKAWPGDGFQLLDSVLEAGALVQCAVAVKHVDAAGSYDVTWTAKPEQGAQLWIVAIQ